MTPEALIRQGTPVTLEQMLAARERRVARQRELLNGGDVLISFTMNMPGEYKCYPLALRAFRVGQREIARELSAHGFAAAKTRAHEEPTGPEGYTLLVGAGARDVKRLMAAIEQGHALGRLFDIDVLDRMGTAVKGVEIGRSERRCIVCGGPVWACARSRAHTAEQLSLHTACLIRDHFLGREADRIAALAARALLYEVCVTPKPGLVDRLGNGAHRDMDLFTFLDSSCALTPYFRETVRAAALWEGDAQGLLPALRYSGRQAERAMCAATGGVNTHKGLIFSMGIVCAALGWLFGRAQAPTPELLFAACAGIAGEAAREHPAIPRTYGETAFRRHGFAGARGEAAQGFPAVRRHGYPALRYWTGRGLSLNDAGVIALLTLMAFVDDTNLVGRSGPAALRGIQQKIRPLIDGEPHPDRLLKLAEELDRELTTAFLSPGGCADLLAISLMVFFLFDGEGAATDE